MVTLKPAIKKIKKYDVKLVLKLKKWKTSNKDKENQNPNVKENEDKIPINKDSLKTSNPDRISTKFIEKFVQKSAAPKLNKSKTKVVDSRTYYWCPDYKALSMNHPEQYEWKKERLGKASVKKLAVQDSLEEEAIVRSLILPQ